MRFFNLHTHKASGNPGVVELINQYPANFDDSIPFYSIGIHPWYISKEKIAEELEFIEQKLLEEHCLAVGECGLDKRIEMPLDLQTEVFEKQLMLAEKYQKPVVIHCVAAFAEAIALKKKWNITVPLMIHGFSKSAQMAKQLLDNDFYLSFGKYLLRNPELETVFKSVPENLFFLETDTIEEGIADVYSLAAKYRNCTVEEIKHQVSNNFETVFKRKLND
ncbi:MAG TPA: TatD family hydrolase [Flavobacterium sp.]|jgi:TatD DNase family protein